MMINGELINSRMTVKEDDKGDLFWDLRLEDVSRKEIEDDLRKSTGEVISYDDYLAEQRRKAEELAKSRRSPWLRKTASNDNFPAVDRFYTKEQMKVIRSTLEETKYLEFLEKIWKDDTSVEKNFQTLREFLDVHEAATPELFEYQAEVGEELLERVLKRREAAQRMGIPEGSELYMDLNKELAYRTYLAAQGDYHKPYRNMAYRPDFYREAHTPRLMSDLFSIRRNTAICCRHRRCRLPKCWTKFTGFTACTGKPNLHARRNNATFGRQTPILPNITRAETKACAGIGKNGSCCWRGRKSGSATCWNIRSFTATIPIWKTLWSGLRSWQMTKGIILS